MSDIIRQAAEADSVNLIKKTHTLDEAEYEKFKKRCEKDGFGASEIIRSFIKAYRAKGEK